MHEFHWKKYCLSNPHPIVQNDDCSPTRSYHHVNCYIITLLSLKTVIAQKKDSFTLPLLSFSHSVH